MRNKTASACAARRVHRFALKRTACAAHTGFVNLTDGLVRMPA
ncbi:hypothetical protein A3768_4788 (plasmid) [Ralstonia solanacearum]|nr:hypothetical protein A3768_4788 [Ralstonia solanacearum]